MGEEKERRGGRGERETHAVRRWPPRAAWPRATCRVVPVQLWVGVALMSSCTTINQ